MDTTPSPVPIGREYARAVLTVSVLSARERGTHGMVVMAATLATLARAQGGR
jgi:hypothetical protein